MNIMLLLVIATDIADFSILSKDQEIERRLRRVEMLMRALNRCDGAMGYRS